MVGLVCSDPLTRLPSAWGLYSGNCCSSELSKGLQCPQDPDPITLWAYWQHCCGSATRMRTSLIFSPEVSSQPRESGRPTQERRLRVKCLLGLCAVSLFRAGRAGRKHILSPKATLRQSEFAQRIVRGCTFSGAPRGPASPEVFEPMEPIPFSGHGLPRFCCPIHPDARSLVMLFDCHNHENCARQATLLYLLSLLWALD